MRARWLKPEFFSDKKIAALGPIAALVYEALWCMADDGGTAPCDADTVKAQMFYRWSAVGVPEISEALHALSAAGRVVRYQVGDDTYATIPRWKAHQVVHKPSKFRYPTMSQGVALPVPEECGTGAAPLPASPPPRHLDTKTPRHPSPPPKGAAEVKFDFAPFAAAWLARYEGPITEKPNVGPLKWLVTKHGPDETLRRWVIYLDATEAQYASAAKLKSGWGQWATPPVTGARGGNLNTPDQARAAVLWTRYKGANLLTRWQRPEYERIGGEQVAAGHYPSLDAFFDELRVTQPWTLADARNDGWAINQIVVRLTTAAPARASA